MRLDRHRPAADHLHRRVRHLAPQAAVHRDRAPRPRGRPRRRDACFRGIEGFGASSLIHTTRLLSLSEDLPVAIVIVDTQDRIRAFLPQLDELVTEGLVILDDCEVIRYVGRRT